VFLVITKEQLTDWTLAVDMTRIEATRFMSLRIPAWRSWRFPRL